MRITTMKHISHENCYINAIQLCENVSVVDYILPCNLLFYLALLSIVLKLVLFVYYLVKLPNYICISMIAS